VDILVPQGHSANTPAASIIAQELGSEYAAPTGVGGILDEASALASHAKRSSVIEEVAPATAADLERAIVEVGDRFGADLQLLHEMLKVACRPHLLDRDARIASLQRRLATAERQRESDLELLRRLREECGARRSDLSALRQALGPRPPVAPIRPEVGPADVPRRRRHLAPEPSGPRIKRRAGLDGEDVRFSAADLKVGSLVHLLNGQGQQGQLLTSVPVPILGFVTDEKAGRYIQYPCDGGVVKYWPANWCEPAGDEDDHV
jgi:hypothetical protein